MIKFFEKLEKKKEKFDSVATKYVSIKMNISINM